MENTPRLFRVFIPVSDLTAAIKFYAELFDAPVVRSAAVGITLIAETLS